MKRCETWIDHEFGEPRLIASGRHPVTGPYQRFEATCDICQRTVFETRPVIEPSVCLSPDGART
jgi:hypothetical protein